MDYRKILELCVGPVFGKTFPINPRFIYFFFFFLFLMNSERFIVYNLLSKSGRGLGIIKGK